MAGQNQKYHQLSGEMAGQHQKYHYVNCSRVWFMIALDIFTGIGHSLACLLTTKCVLVTHLSVQSEPAPKQHTVMDVIYEASSWAQMASGGSRGSQMVPVSPMCFQLDGP